MSNDPYTRVHALAVRLREIGRGLDAEALERAIEAGSTGTEIFMALHWNLEKVLSTPLPTDLRDEAASLCAFIEQALK